MILGGKYAVNSRLGGEQAFEIQAVFDGLTARVKRPWRSWKRTLWVMALGALIATPGASLLLRHSGIWTLLLFVASVAIGQAICWAVDRRQFKKWSERRESAVREQGEFIQQLTDSGDLVDVSPLESYVFDEEELSMDRLRLALDLHDAVTHERATVESLRASYEQGRLSTTETRDYLVALDVFHMFTRAAAEALR